MTARDTDKTTPQAEQPTTTQPEQPTTTQPEQPTTTQALAVAAEIHARIGTALDALSDAAELAAEPAALPDALVATVLRTLSQAHRYTADGYVLTSVQAVGSARIVEMTTPTDAGRRVICTCGLSFTPGAWQQHHDTAPTRDGEEHQQAGQLVSAGPRNRRRPVELLLPDEDRGGA